jgi:hypothetical protein
MKGQLDEKRDLFRSLCANAKNKREKSMPRERKRPATAELEPSSKSVIVDVIDDESSLDRKPVRRAVKTASSESKDESAKPASSNLWLMKSDSDFPLSKLVSSPKQTHMWDGVRNHQVIQCKFVG